METCTSENELGFTKCGLLYDAEEVTLIGKFTDQLSAYRARRVWVEVFGNYFLLEDDRDFKISINTSLEERNYSVHCSFSSACGRYAFWRLINQQAPEAEERLGTNNLVPAKGSKSILANILNSPTSDPTADKRLPWIVHSIDQQVEENRETSNMIQKLIKLFQS